MVQENESYALNQSSHDLPSYSSSDNSLNRTTDANIDEKVDDEWKLDENDDSIEERREIRSLVDDLDDEDQQYENSNNSNSDMDVTTNLDQQMNDDDNNSKDESTDNTSKIIVQEGLITNDQDVPLNLSSSLLSEGAASSHIVVANASNEIQMTNPLRLVPSAPFLLHQPLNPPQGWDQLVRSGTRIKALFSDAIGEVKNSIVAVQNHSKKRSRDSNDDDNCTVGESPSKQSRVVAVADFTVELAREKTAQVMQLQRQLKDAQAQAAAIQAANSSLREETSSGQSRLDRTVEALRIANNNVTKARAEADAAEAKASTLAQTLQNLQTVLTETKSAAQILHQEQQALNDTVTKVESKLIKKEAEIFNAKKEIAILLHSNESLENMKSQWVKDREKLELQVKQSKHELEELRREKMEVETMEMARKDRSNKVEEEWRKTQTLLIEATAGQVAAQRTQALLEETIASLQKANDELHASLTAQQRIARDDKNRLTEALGKVEKEAQRLRIAAEATNEEIARFTANKTSNEKQIQQLKSRLSIAERSLKEATLVPLLSTPAQSNTSPTDVATPSIMPNQLSFHLPPLSGATKKMSLPSGPMPTPTITDKENVGVNNGELCCVCYKANIGIMKVCQCGATDCHKKAHINCIKFLSTPAGPSVSHPGTPAPKLPIVICDSVLSKIRPNITASMPCTNSGSNVNSSSSNSVPATTD